MGNSTVSVRPTLNFLMVCLSTSSSKECCSIASIESSSMHLNIFSTDELEHSQTRRKYGVERTLIVELPTSVMRGGTVCKKGKKISQKKKKSCEILS